MPGRLHIHYHAFCFDGVTTAAVFNDFYQATFGAHDVSFFGLEHAPTDPYTDSDLSADVNASLDFRYCADPRMHWWIDHHISTFQQPGDREQFESSDNPQHIYDASARSCVGLALRELGKRFSYRPQFARLDFIEWADRIDAADFASAAEAIDLSAPAMQVAAWLRTRPSQDKIDQLLGMLGQQTLAAIVDAPWLRDELSALRDGQRQSIQSMRKGGVTRGNVAYYCQLNGEQDFSNKLALYYLFPACQYAVGVFRADNSVKISVGVNPWSGHPNDVNIASVCEQYGGGGHPYVGGISMPEEKVDRALEVAEAIITLLNRRTRVLPAG